MRPRLPGRQRQKPFDERPPEKPFDTPSSEAKPLSPDVHTECGPEPTAYSFALPRPRAGWPFRLESAERLIVVSGTNDLKCNNALLTCQANDTPSDQKNCNAHRKESRVRAERSRREQIHQQQPHPHQLCRAPEQVSSSLHLLVSAAWRRT